MEKTHRIEGHKRPYLFVLVLAGTVVPRIHHTIPCRAATNNFIGRQDKRYNRIVMNYSAHGTRR